MFMLLWSSAWRFTVQHYSTFCRRQISFKTMAYGDKTVLTICISSNLLCD